MTTRFLKLAFCRSDQVRKSEKGKVTKRIRQDIRKIITPVISITLLNAGLAPPNLIRRSTCRIANEVKKKMKILLLDFVSFNWAKDLKISIIFPTDDNRNANTSINSPAEIPNLFRIKPESTAGISQKSIISIFSR
jgi:hypothetical protein